MDDASFAALQANSEEDSDTWMNVDEADVDAIMEERSNVTQPDRRAQPSSDAKRVDAESSASAEAEMSAERDPAVEAAADRLGRLAQKVEKFVDSRGDVEGALFEECVALRLVSCSVV